MSTASADVSRDEATDGGGPLVLSARHGAVEVLALNRPERLNAWSDALEEEYFALLRRAEADPLVRAVVVTGAGRGFCAGADMDLLAEVSPEDSAEQPEQRRDRSYPYSFPKPLVAAVNGAVAGIGMVQALYCDVRFTTPDAKWTTAFAKRGLVAEYGISWLLPRLVGQSRALDLLLSSAVVTGDEAVRMGLATRLSDPGSVVADAVAYAEHLATWSSPWSMATMKEQVRADSHGSFADAEERAYQGMLASFARADLQEGVASYLEKRAPEFPPLA